MSDNAPADQRCRSASWTRSSTIWRTSSRRSGGARSSPKRGSRSWRGTSGGAVNLDLGRPGRAARAGERAVCRAGSRRPAPGPRQMLDRVRFLRQQAQGGRAMSTKKHTLRVTILNEEYAIRSDTPPGAHAGGRAVSRPGDPEGDVERCGGRVQPRRGARGASDHGRAVRGQRGARRQRIESIDDAQRIRATAASAGKAPVRLGGNIAQARPLLPFARRRIP